MTVGLWVMTTGGLENLVGANFRTLRRVYAHEVTPSTTTGSINLGVAYAGSIIAIKDTATTSGGSLPIVTISVAGVLSWAPDTSTGTSITSYIIELYRVD